MVSGKDFMSGSSKIEQTITSKDQYFANDLRAEIKKLKIESKPKNTVQQMNSRIQHLNKKISFLNERVDYMNQKVKSVQHEFTNRLEQLETNISRLYKRLIISLGILAAASLIFLILDHFFFKL